MPGPLAARRSGAATTDALRLPSAFGTALSCCAGTDRSICTETEIQWCKKEQNRI